MRSILCIICTVFPGNLTAPQILATARFRGDTIYTILQYITITVYNISTVYAQRSFVYLEPPELRRRRRLTGDLDLDRDRLADRFLRTGDRDRDRDSGLRRCRADPLL